MLSGDTRMLRTQSVFKTVLSLLLSTMMVLPTGAYAKASDTLKPGATDDVPVIFENVVFNGQPATMLMMPIDATIEESFVFDWAKQRAENSALMVSGPGDKVLAAAASSGNLGKLNVYTAADIEQSAIINRGDLSNSFKQKIVDQVKKITKAAKSERAVGIYFALAYSGIMGSFAYYQSSSLTAGLAVFGMYAMWNSFTLSRPDLLGKVIDGGGDLSVALGKKVAGMIGKELSPRDKQLWEVGGKFAASWGINTVQSSYVKGWTGEFASLSGLAGFAEGFFSTSLTGAQNNYNIWDAVVLKSQADGGWFTEKRVKWYMRIALIAGAIAEGLAMGDAPGVGPALMAVTASGTMYLALNPQMQSALNRNVVKAGVSLRSGVTSVVRPSTYQQLKPVRKVASGARFVKRACSEILASPKAPYVHQRVSYQDMD